MIAVMGLTGAGKTTFIADLPPPEDGRIQVQRNHETLRPRRPSYVWACVGTECGKTFASRNDLNRHEKAVHAGETRSCGSTELRPRLDNFKQHLIRMHRDQDSATSEFARPPCGSCSASGQQVRLETARNAAERHTASSPEDDDRDAIFGFRCNGSAHKWHCESSAPHPGMGCGNSAAVNRTHRDAEAINEYWRDVIQRTCTGLNESLRHDRIEPRPDGEDWIRAECAPALECRA
jgi:hypothetical protein